MPKGMTTLTCGLYDIEGRNAEIEARRAELAQIHGDGDWTASYHERKHALIWSYIPTPQPLGGLRDVAQEADAGLL